ncbi:hypothetical protein CXU14_09545 [Akkermansia muciniphila]|nr:hypothetical protein CXU16_00125 [Akkermansia muciniphila]PNC44005.1 hypothetical protein CXU14_09545 [Akkermansia muciniphila]
MINIVHGEVRGKFNLEPALPAAGNIPGVISPGDTAENGINVLSEPGHMIDEATSIVGVVS